MDELIAWILDEAGDVWVLYCPYTDGLWISTGEAVDEMEMRGVVSEFN